MHLGFELDLDLIKRSSIKFGSASFELALFGSRPGGHFIIFLLFYVKNEAKYRLRHKTDAKTENNRALVVPAPFIYDCPNMSSPFFFLL